MTASGRARRRYVDGPTGQIHVAEAGDGPVLLCLHQTPRSWDEFRELIDLLADDFHVVAIDLPGMGASDPLPGPASIEGYAAAALAAVDALGVDRFDVCGHHTGGVVAIELAASVPSRVHRLALSSTPWVDAEARVARAEHPPPVDQATPAADGSHLVALWDQRRRFYPDRRELLDRYLVDALRAGDPHEGHTAVGRYEMERRVPLIACPVLVIEHAADPFATRHTTELARRVAAVSTVSIPHGAIPLEHAAADVAEALRAFLA